MLVAYWKALRDRADRSLVPEFLFLACVRSTVVGFSALAVSLCHPHSPLRDLANFLSFAITNRETEIMSPQSS